MGNGEESLRRLGSAVRPGSDARIARIMLDLLTLVLTLQAVTSTLTALDYRWDPWVKVVNLTTLALVVGSYVVIERRLTAGRVTPRLRWGQDAVALAALGLVFLDTWTPLILAAALLLIDPLSYRRLLSRAAILSVVFVALLFRQGTDWYDVIPTVIILWVTAGVILVLSRLITTVRELVRTREQVARMKVDEERHRMSRDLHDILGRSLVAVSLRLQTVDRLLANNSPDTRSQLAEAIATVDQAQTRLRHLSRGVTVVDFGDEASAAKEMFDRLGIRTIIDADEIPPDEQIQEVLARVLRESVTNMLKHSRPELATITLTNLGTAVRLEVVNDGTPPSADAGGRRGTGLQDVTERVRMIGGNLNAGSRGEAAFSVVAELPLPAPNLHIPHRLLVPGSMTKGDRNA